MFAVSHWQLKQNRCLANEAVLCSITAVPAAAGTSCPANPGAAGVGIPEVAVGWSVVWGGPAGGTLGSAAAAGGLYLPP